MLRSIPRPSALWLLALLATTGACTGVQAPRPTLAPADTPAPEATSPMVAPTSTAAPVPTPTDSVPQTWRDSEWKTDFSQRSVPLREIRSGGPPRDGIPPIDHPKFVSVGEADTWLAAQEPVINLSVEGIHRAYPLQILTWHEIVNDTIGDVPVAVTFCPLCNTAIAFDRQVGDRVLDFGTTGNLRHSDLVMWDRQTESWWQQLTGEAIVGKLTGTQLTFLPAAIVAWSDFKSSYPRGQVLSRDTGFARDYGRNPYPGYDDVGNVPFLFDGKSDPRLPAMTRVVGMSISDEAIAVPFPELESRRVVQTTVGGQPVVVFFQPGVTSALDQGNIANSREIGAAAVFQPVVEGRLLEFNAVGDQIVDRDTGSTWDISGRAVSGPLAGQRLEPIVHANHFFFALAAFYPGVKVWQPE